MFEKSYSAQLLQNIIQDFFHEAHVFLPRFFDLCLQLEQTGPEFTATNKLGDKKP